MSWRFGALTRAAGCLAVIAALGPACSAGDAPTTSGRVFVFESELPVAAPGIGRSAASATFALPDHATQGDGEWYGVDLIIAVTAAVWPPPAGVNYVTLATNGLTAAQIEFAAPGGDRNLVTWRANDMFPGASHGLFASSTLVRFRNILRLGGVKGGANEITLRIEQDLGHVLTSARILAGSAVTLQETLPGRDQ